EAVPDVDVDDAGVLGAGAVEIVEVAGVGGRGRAADRRHAHTDHRHALALHRCDRVVDALGVDLLPALGAEFGDATGAALRFRPEHGRRLPVFVVIVLSVGL